MEKHVWAPKERISLYGRFFKQSHFDRQPRERPGTPVHPGWKKGCFFGDFEKSG